MGADYEEDYFVWLCANVIDPQDTGQAYWQLLGLMHKYEFVWVIPGDANRSADGHDLRKRYLNLFKLTPDVFDDYGTAETSVSVLEVLVALTKHAEFQTGCSESFWFMKFIENLGLLDEYDAGGVNHAKVDSALYRLVWRTYDYNGVGGLFPLRKAPEDQREVELWFQFFEYIESEMVGR